MLWGVCEPLGPSISCRQGQVRVPHGAAASSADISGDPLWMLRAAPDTTGTGVWRVVPFVQTSWKVPWVRVLGRGGCLFVTFLSHFIPRGNLLLPDYRTPRRQGQSCQSQVQCVVRCGWRPLQPALTLLSGVLDRSGQSLDAGVHPLATCSLYDL